MASKSDNIKYYKKELEEAIKDGVELFKHYKEISKEFQEKQKILMNNTELKKELANLKEKYDEVKKNINAERRKIIENKELATYIKQLHFRNTNVKEKELKNKYEKELIKRKEAHKKLSEMYLVNYDKKFLKDKEKIRKEKIRILSRIKIALAELKKKMFVPEFKEFIKYLNADSYNIAENKQITFKKLMHHLESGEITEEAAKKTKKINELQSINNIDYRKSEIEYEIEKLKKEKEKNLLYKKLLEIDENIKKIFKKNFKGTNIPEKLSLIIKIIDQQKTIPKDDKEKVKLLKRQLKIVLKKLQASS